MNISSLYYAMIVLTLIMTVGCKSSNPRYYHGELLYDKDRNIFSVKDGDEIRTITIMPNYNSNPLHSHVSKQVDVYLHKSKVFFILVNDPNGYSYKVDGQNYSLQRIDP